MRHPLLAVFHLSAFPASQVDQDESPVQSAPRIALPDVQHDGIHPNAANPCHAGGS